MPPCLAIPYFMLQVGLSCRGNNPTQWAHKKYSQANRPFQVPSIFMAKTPSTAFLTLLPRQPVLSCLL